MNLRRVALGVVILLFVSLLAFGPELVSAKRAKDDARSAKSRIVVHSDRNASEERESDKRRDRRPAKKSSNDKPNAFGKVVRFVKNLVTKSESEAEQAGEDEEENDDDLPPFLRGKIDRQEYLTARQEWVNMKLGMTPGLTYDPMIRSHAIDQMTAQKEALKAQLKKSGNRGMIPEIATNVWTELGPKPIPNGQTSSVNQPVAGRTVAIAIHPTNPNIVYVGGAQAGVYRSLNGGQTWTPIFDGAASLVIGALALAPSNPTSLRRHRRGGQCGSGCYAGIGLYRSTMPRRPRT